LPVIRTLHGHEPYCPSGSRYHKFQQRPCNRTYSVAGCLWGHFASHCGSVRPKSLLNEFRRTWREMHSLPRIPVITVSEFLKKEMLRAGYSGDAIHVLRTYAPDPKPYSPPAQEGAPRFAFIGRMTPEKGVAWFLRSIQKVKIPIQVDIAGEGPSEAELRALTVQLGLHDRVTFHGWVNAEKVHALLGGARSLVFPSIWHEPGGAVAGEAMVNGRAVIMSRVGGMPEYVRHEVNGLLVNPNDVEELTGAIERLATDWELARSLGETGRQIAQEQFSFQGHVQRLGCLYAQTISEYESLGK
jgi:glycosyltransferase involved in cell wall biosynthesis